MIGGSFIAGASPESGGAFAFPIMTLIYNFTPNVMKNFSLAIQSFGMTAASLFIYRTKIVIDKQYLLFSVIGGTIGVIIGSPIFKNFGHPEYLKMLFFSFWLSFGFVLFYLNQIKKREVSDNLPSLNNYQKFTLIVIGFLGGILTSILGSGIDIFTFAYVTMKYNLSEKVATPTSIIIMAINSIVGFFMYSFVLNDFTVQEFQLVVVSFPIVLIGAPIGVYFVNKVRRTLIADFLYVVLALQFITAILILKPQNKLLVFSIIVFVIGIIIFSFFGKIFLFTTVLKKILVPEKFIGRNFDWDTNQSVGYNIDRGFWKSIISKKYILAILFIVWSCIFLFYTKGNFIPLIKSPIPLIIIIVSIVASVIANSTAAGGGIILLPIFSIVFLEFLKKIDISHSFFYSHSYTLSGIIIAIHVTQSFGMLSGSISWWKSGVKILFKENIFNIFGVLFGVIISKYYWQIDDSIVFKIFGFANLFMSFVVFYNLIIVKNIPTCEIFNKRLSWIFFFVGIIGGLLSGWTSIGIGSLTSFILVLFLKPEIGIANGSVMMALTSITTVIIHLLIGMTIPIEIILFTIPAVLMGGYAAPFFGMWVGKKFYRVLVKLNPNIKFNKKGNKINTNILEYTSGQLVMSISFIVVCLFNGIYYVFFN